MTLNITPSELEMEIRGFIATLAIRYTDSKSTVSISHVTEMVCAKTGTPIDLVRSKSRKEQTSFTRHMICYVLREKLGLPFKDIAGIVNMGNHTSVMHANYKIQSRVMKSKRIKDMVDNFFSEIDKSKSSV